jgi:hypothetical protein
MTLTMTETNAVPEKTEDTDAVAESDADAGNNEKSGRRYGHSFIYLALKDAEDAVRKIDGNERRMPRKSFAQALGHRDAVGRFTHKLAALEGYDLVKVQGDTVKLTDLAVEMLYGPTEQARIRARAKAFLSYPMFKETFVQCPKNQDHKMSFVDDFVRVSLKIVNDRNTFLKRFLESAAYAGLLEGKPDPKADAIRLRPAVAAPTTGEAPQAPAESPDDQWVIFPPDEIGSLLDGLGLTSYSERCDVSQRAAGEIAINMADKKITIELRRPQRVVIRTDDMLADVTVILKALKSKGFKT